MRAPTQQPKRTKIRLRRRRVETVARAKQRRLWARPVQPERAQYPGHCRDSCVVETENGYVIDERVGATASSSHDGAVEW